MVNKVPCDRTLNSLYSLITSPYFFSCLEQFYLLAPFFNYKKAKNLKIFYWITNLKYFCVIYLHGLKFTPLCVKNLYWWNFFYSESDFVLPHTKFVDEIILLSKGSARVVYDVWYCGLLVKARAPYSESFYIEGAQFNRAIYSRCERPLDYRVLKIKYKISWFFYYIIAVL